MGRGAVTVAKKPWSCQQQLPAWPITLPKLLPSQHCRTLTRPPGAWEEREGTGQLTNSHLPTPPPPSSLKVTLDCAWPRLPWLQLSA